MRTILAGLIILSTSFSYAGDLVAILVANTLPREENRGREHDVYKMADEMEAISKHTGLNLNLNVYIHEDYNSQILDKLQNIEVKPDDVLFFYYSGHGYRDSDKTSPWPNLVISLEDLGVDFQTITTILKEKNPRLLLAMANSCNKSVSQKIELLKKGIDFTSKERIQENYKKLFLDQAGAVISSSSLPGQYSYRRPETGTLYLEAFLAALHEEVKGKEAHWESIFKQTVKKTLELSKGKQKPQYELDFKE
jgi:hypothetical protein